MFRPLTSIPLAAALRQLPTGLIRYGLPLLVIVLANLLRLALEPLLGTAGFAISLLAMLIAAMFGGIGPCLTAQTLNLVLSSVWFGHEETKHTTALAKTVSLAAYYSVGLFIAILSDRLRAALSRAHAQRQQAEFERERLRATLACMGDGVLTCDDQLRVTLVNAVAEALLGWTPDAVRQSQLGEVFRASSVGRQADASDVVRQALREQQIVHVSSPVTMLTQAGASLPVTYSVAPIWDARGQITGAVLVFRNETERLNVENALRDSDRRKDEFLATLAHELRNPLAPICLGVDLLKVAPNNEETVEEVREMISRQARHMVRLIDDLLDVSRITRGKLELRRCLVNLNDVVRNAVEETRQLFQTSGNELILDLPEQPPLFFADPNRLTQIISNLLNNAAKYTPAGGRVELCAEQIEDELVLTVADNGLGLPPDQRETIFEMFTQVKHSLESGQSGLGIGLTLVKRLVELHGGTVRVESDGLHCGSRFEVRLPLVFSAPLTEHAPLAHLTPALTLQAKRVMVVDDNEDAQKTLSAMLRLMGHEVRVAADGLEALEVAGTFRPEIIFMDLGMPRMNGFDAARHLRQSAWAKESLLVATTGWGQPDDRARTHEAGFDHHLVKPIDALSVQRLLNQAQPCAARSASTPHNDSEMLAHAGNGRPFHVSQ